MLSREDVATAYRFLLGRAPDDEAAYAYHRRHATIDDLRQEFMQSPEFHEIYRSVGSMPVWKGVEEALPPVASIETGAEGPDRDEMWKRIADTWSRFGVEAPHWSVLTADGFTPDRIEENRQAFADSVAGDLSLIDAAFARLPDADALRAGTCLEVGSGVGRATIGLGRRFAKVVGVDVSAPHLAIARKEIDAAGLDNVDLRCIEGIGDYDALAGADFFYSRIVLQHNPPPVQAAILRSVLAGLSTPAAALFQVITHIDGYAFSIRRYLEDGGDRMEMHVLPQGEVFEIFRETGFDVVEVRRDDSGGPEEAANESTLFLASRSA